MIDNTIVCLMGPTGAGKSAVAMRWAKEFPMEIVSVDSAMVYRGMNIGTAKPTPEELKKVRHHLIDIRDPVESYSAADFCDDAQEAINDIFTRKKIPLLVGGTMLYFKALQEGLSELPSADAAIRDRLSQEAELKGWPAMHQKLEHIDPNAAKRIHPNDAQRIQRALEIFEITGESMTSLCRKPVTSLPFDVINLGIMCDDRDRLHRRIEERLEIMLEQGFVNEVQNLYQRNDLNRDLPAMRSVGYRQVWDYLANRYDFDTMRQKILAATRQLAKRQLTWLRSWPDLHQTTADLTATAALHQLLSH